MRPESREELLKRVQELEQRLTESEETLQALRRGEVDAIVASGPDGDQIYTLKGADQAYRQIVEDMTEGALTLARDGLILFSNERFASLLGTPLEQIIGSYLQNFVSAEDADVLAALGSTALRQGKAEVRLQAPGKTAVPAYLSWKRVTQDAIECVSVIVTDLSEQRRNEEIVSAAKLARSILEQAADAMLVTDLNGGIILASRASDRLAGVSVLLRNFDEVFQVRHSPDSRGYTFSEIISKAKQGAAVEHVETAAATPDGRTVQLLLGSAPLASPTGELLGCIISLIDITERKEMEKALRESEKMLRQSAEELRASNDALSRSNEDLARFAFIASHDLQEPLRMITAYAQLLAAEYQGRDENNVIMYVGNIVDGTQRMSELIADLLAYTEVRGDSEELLEVVDLNGVIESVQLNLKASIDDSGAVITSDPLPVISAHASHAVALFQNLIGNAIKYRRDEPPRVHISIQEAEGELRFAVRDNGIGIDPEYHKTIFVAFKRLHARKIPGTGIGLAICQRVVERYGGRIWVESEVGHGATFHFVLPNIAVQPSAREAS
jgi:PAS domain S-box-containing protein